MPDNKETDLHKTDIRGQAWKTWISPFPFHTITASKCPGLPGWIWWCSLCLGVPRIHENIVSQLQTAPGSNGGERSRSKIKWELNIICSRTFVNLFTAAHAILTRAPVLLTISLFCIAGSWLAHIRISLNGQTLPTKLPWYILYSNNQAP